MTMETLTNSFKEEKEVRLMDFVTNLENKNLIKDRVLTKER